MSTHPTIEGLKELMEEFNLTQLIGQLNDKSFDRCKKMTKEDWEKIAGVFKGIQIYNYLNPIPVKTLSLQLLTNEFQAVYDKYDQIGLTLSTEPIIVNIMEQLLGIFAFNTVDKTPFVFIEDSSGAGKTQAAFALKHALARRCPQRKFVHLLCLELDQRSQEIYKVFNDISLAFLQCAERDLRNLDSTSLSCLTLSGRSLFIFGFFLQLLTNPEAGMKFEQKLASDVCKILDGNLPVVILDEFPSIESSSSQYLRFLRNSIRALKFGLVVMGTNSTAANLLESNSQSRKGEKHDWCYLFPRLPAVKIEHLDLSPNTPPWIQDILKYSRPLFSWIASQFLSNFTHFDLTITEIDDWLSKVAAEIAERKEIFQNLYGRHGQVCLFLNMSYLYSKEQQTHSSPLIHRHFARLVDGDVLCLKNNLTIGGSFSPWSPRSCFPSPNEDLLLFLCLMGTKSFFPFRVSSSLVTNCSFRKAAQEVEQSINARTLIFNCGNAAQATNDGMFLEALLASSLCVSSHGSGLGGSALHSFISSIWSHCSLFDEFKTFTLELPKYRPLANFLREFEIPVLAPPNQEWPEWIHSVPGAKFGWLRRTRNEDRFDIATSFHLTGESKDYKSNITTEIMKKMLQRVPKTSKVHIIFVRQLQTEYFTKARFPFPNFCCCVIKSQGNGILKLCDVKGMPGIQSYKRNVSKLVLLFPIG